MGDLLPESTVGGKSILTEGSEIKQGPRGAGAEPWYVTLYTADGQPVQVPIPVTLTGQTMPPAESPNKVLAEGKITFGFSGKGAIDVPASQSRGVMLSVQSDDEFSACKLSFLHVLDGGVTVPWFDGDGNPVTVSLPANKAVIGPFQGWPRFEGGQLQAHLTGFDPLEWSNVNAGDDTAYGVAVDHEGCIYVGTYGGNVRKISAEGTTLWVTPVLSRIFGIDVDTSGNVFSVGDQGVIFALDPNGSELWTYNVGNRSQTIMVEGNYVYVNPRGSPRLIKLDVSGASEVTPPVEVWSIPLSSTPYANIVKSGNRLYAGDSNTLYAFNEASSPPTEMWTNAFTGLQALGFDADRDVLYASGTSGILSAFDAQTGGPIWSTDVGQNVIGLAVDDNGYIYTSGLNSVQKISPDGEIIDSYVSGPRSNRIVAFGGAVYVGYSTDDSRVVKLAPPDIGIDVTVREVV